MRVIHNLTHPENTIVDSANDVYSSLKSIKKLLSNSNDILEFLKNKNLSISKFSKWQTTEEIIKAHLITKNDKWKMAIEETEQNKYFNGQIGFILEFAGILEYYSQQNNCDWNQLDDSTYYDSFCNYANKATIVFKDSYEDRENDKNYVFERAVLTKGLYFSSASSNRLNLLSSTSGSNIKRDHSWKRLLRIDLDNLMPDSHRFIKEVFDDPRFDTNNLEESLEEICRDRTNTWKDLFISLDSSTDLIDYCKQGYIRFMSKDDILLYHASQVNHLHVELYSYNLWKSKIEPIKSSFTLFDYIYYRIVKGSSDISCIVLDNFIYREKSYGISIYHNVLNGTENHFQMNFYEMNESTTMNEFDEEIESILERNRFKAIAEYDGVFSNIVGVDELITNLIEVTNDLKSLNDD